MRQEKIIQEKEELIDSNLEIEDNIANNSDGTDDFDEINDEIMKQTEEEWEDTSWCASSSQWHDQRSESASETYHREMREKQWERNNEAARSYRGDARSAPRGSLVSVDVLYPLQPQHGRIETNRNPRSNPPTPSNTAIWQPRLQDSVQSAPWRDARQQTNYSNAQHNTRNPFPTRSSYRENPYQNQQNDSRDSPLPTAPWGWRPRKGENRDTWYTDYPKGKGKSNK